MGSMTIFRENIRMKKLLGLAVLILVTAVMGYGQAISVNGGSIQGTITDTSGAVVSSATVMINGERCTRACGCSCTT